jgi:hypothetical protein
MRSSIANGIAALAAALASMGCCPASHLVYVYDLSIGIDTAYSNEGTGRMVFGYDRGTYAIVPQRQDAAATEGAADTSTGELMSLVAVSNVESRGATEFQFDHLVATGTAAERVAQSPRGLEQIRNAIFGPTPARPVGDAPGGQ